jgi:hypothetical protein
MEVLYRDDGAGKVILEIELPISLFLNFLPFVKKTTHTILVNLWTYG